MTGFRRGSRHTEWNIIQPQKDEIMPFAAT